MKLQPPPLPDDVATLQKMVLELQAENHRLLEQFRLAQQRRFGKSAEAHAGQGELFNEAEQLIEEAVEPEQDVISVSRNKPKRQPLPKDLPREVIVHDIAEADKVCGGCGGALHKMGEDKSEQLEFIPARIKVIEHVRLKYSCRSCDKAGAQIAIKIAPAPASPIPKSFATPSLLAQVITNKYQYGLPLYRQERLFAQHGIELNRKSMAHWMLKCAERLKPITDRWREVLLRQPVIQADETTVNVLGEDKATCYMWLYCSGADSPGKHAIPNIVLYDYRRSRSGQCAADFLRGFNGYLQVDGYAGYEQTDATLAGCWAHARRKFIEAQQAQGKHKAGLAQWALSHIQKLYRIESAIKDKSAEEKRALRQRQASPLLWEYKEWLDQSVILAPPKSAIGKAMSYSLNQWSKLIRYVEDGDIAIDNNRAERAIKPFVIGRKNWLFANTARGAEASAVLYSLIETAKANGLIPFDYLMHLLTEQARQLSDDRLMPWNLELKQKI